MCVNSRTHGSNTTTFWCQRVTINTHFRTTKRGKGLEIENILNSSEVYLLVALAKALKVAPQSGPGQVWRAVFSIYLSLIYYATVC